MAAVPLTYEVLENSARNFILHIVGVNTATTVAFTLDGTTAGIIAANGYTPTIHFKVRRILYNTTNCAVRLQWHQTANAELITLSGYGDYDLKNTQGIINPAGAGSTGDIDLSTYPVAAVTAGAGVITDALSLTLECIKGV